MQQYAIILRRRERQQLTLDDLAVHANVHPEVVLQFVEFGLINVKVRDVVPPTAIDPAPNALLSVGEIGPPVTLP